MIATANDRDKGVNDLSAALRAAVQHGGAAAARRAWRTRWPSSASASPRSGAALELPAELRDLAEIERVVTVFRELRAGVTRDGRTSLKSPTATLSTAEAISVMTNGLALAAHFGDGTPSAADVAAGITGAVVKDPVQDRLVWQEYLETVVRERPGWGDLYRACRELAVT